MKLSTSTLGCLQWDLPTLIARLREYGFDGVDLRGFQQNLKLWETPEFSSGISTTAARLRDAGLAVSCISSGICLTHGKPAKVAEADEELLRTAEICASLGCGQIRVFGGDLRLFDKAASEADRDRITSHAAECCARLAGKARSIAPVDILVETHDSWADSRHLADLLGRVNREDVGCCWDVKHTWWIAKETAERTWGRLGRWVRNTHWKDVRRHRGSNEGFRLDLKEHGMLVPMGEGILPAADACDLLAGSGYDGWLTLEWEKLWHPHIAEPETAFPAFVRYMRATPAVLRSAVP